MPMTNKDKADIENSWPKLPPLEAWQDTCATVHMWTQVVGKVRLMLSPDINHTWGWTLYVTTRGLDDFSNPLRRFYLRDRLRLYRPYAAHLHFER